MVNTNIKLLKKIAIFKSVNAKDLSSLAGLITIKSYKPKDQIYSPADTNGRIYFLFNGQVKLYELSFSGKKVIVDLIDHGSIFGDITTDSKDSSSVKNFAESIGYSTIGIAAKEYFLSFLIKQPTIALKVVDLLAQRLNQAEEKIKDLSLGKIENRILHELVRFSKKNGRETKRLYVVTQKITHEELAGMVGTTRETVTKTLNELKRKRVISVDLNRLYRLDKQKLVYYAVY